jgi:hypothetical protein
MVPTSTEHLSFRVDGGTLVTVGEAEKDPINRYRILENSKTALVAANGGTFDFFEEGPRVSATLLMIEKATGKFVYVIAEVGPANDHTTGTCKIIPGSRH